MDSVLTQDAAIGYAAAIVFIPIIVSHVKGFARRIEAELHGWGYGPDATPWPLVSDLAGVAYSIGLWQSGHAPEWIDNLLTAVLAGFALGVAASVARNRVVDATEAIGNVQVRTAPAEPEPDRAGVTEPGSTLPPRSGTG